MDKGSIKGENDGTAGASMRDNSYYVRSNCETQQGAPISEKGPTATVIPRRNRATSLLPGGETVLSTWLVGNTGTYRRTAGLCLLDVDRGACVCDGITMQRAQFSLHFLEAECHCAEYVPNTYETANVYEQEGEDGWNRYHTS